MDWRKRMKDKDLTEDDFDQFGFKKHKLYVGRNVLGTYYVYITNQEYSDNVGRDGGIEVTFSILNRDLEVIHKEMTTDYFNMRKEIPYEPPKEIAEKLGIWTDEWKKVKGIE